MGAARIGRVRMKNGGADVRVLHCHQVSGRENYRGKLVDHARIIGDMDEPGSELVGFVLIGLFSDGKSTVGCRFDPTTSPIPRALLPAYVAEIIRRDLVTSAEAEEVACDVVNRANGFPDDDAS